MTLAVALDPVDWTPQCQTTFQALKDAVITTPVLSQPDYSETFHLFTDASNRCVGAVLAQKQDGEHVDHPIVYKRKLPREQHYSVMEKEGLATVSACKHFLPYLVSR